MKSWIERASSWNVVEVVRPHPGQVQSAKNLVRMLENSEVRESHRNCGKVQDAYSMRCMPQVHGAVRDALDHCLRVFEIEMNSAVDNPLVFVAPKQPGKKDENGRRGVIISGGNFHGEPIAFALDFLAIALSALAGISERRIAAWWARVCGQAIFFSRVAVALAFLAAIVWFVLLPMFGLVPAARDGAP